VQVRLPYRARSYQRPFLQAMASGVKRAALVWHRRAGKDTTAWSWMISAAFNRVGTYYYFAPTYAQAKKILWDGKTSRGMEDDGLDENGVAFRSFVPPEAVEKWVEDEMQCWLRNGSLIQLVGTDKLDSVRGANTVGAVFSEYSVSKEEAWSKIVEPILLENGGWAVFVYTPMGQNHGYKLFNYAQTQPDWYSSLLTIRDTSRPDGRPIVDPAEIDKKIAAGMLDRETADQEYYCSFLGAIVGAYYATQMRWLAQNARIAKVPWDPRLPVATWWDLGYDDSTTIWYVQRTGGEVRLIDYEEHSGEGLPFYAKLCQEKPYTYSHHVMPHDIEVHELGSGVRRRETAIKLGLKPVVVCARHQIHDGIDAVRGMLQRCWFDADKCERGLQSLREYRKDFDPEKAVYKKTPRHDQWSHGADAFRTGAKGDSRTPITDHKQQFTDGDFDPRTYLKDRQYDDFDPRGVTTWR
jgi:phage terminase large subunit